MKKLPYQKYKLLAKEALFDFKNDEGRDASNLLCELASNIPDDLKIENNIKFDPKLLAKAIKDEFIGILNC